MRYIVLILCGLAVACGDDTPPKKDTTDNNIEDVGPDFEQDSDGGNNGEDVGPDADMESPCALVDCIENSECVEVDGLAICECLSGFEKDGELCVPVNVAPSFTNLPGEEVGQRGQADGFMLTATDPNSGDSLSYGILQSTCGFDIQVIANTGAVSWICPANTLTCAATMQVKDDSGLTAEGVLTIQCVRSLPVISSTAPTTAAEAQTLQYAVQCSDPEGGAVTVTKAADDTCGGTTPLLFIAGQLSLLKVRATRQA